MEKITRSQFIQKYGFDPHDKSSFTKQAPTTGAVSGSNITVPKQTLTPDEDFDGSAATPIAPQAGTITVSGSRIAASPITETYNSTGELVKVKYEAQHEFCGQVVNDHDVCATTIARGLIGEE